MNTQEGSSAGLNTVNYVIFLNISDSAVSACEELPGSQIQSASPLPHFQEPREVFKYSTESSCWEVHSFRLFLTFKMAACDKHMALGIRAPCRGGGHMLGGT